MENRKNVLFITSDQQHWYTLGRLNPEISTPNLDKLAARGTTFSRAYTVNPTCTPTRASWITGLYPSQHGAWSLGTKLDESIPTIGDMMHRQGVKSTLIGKAHFQPLESTKEFNSLEAYPILQDLNYWRNFKERFYGFDQVELARNHTNEAHVGQHYAIWLEEQGCDNWREYFLPPTGTMNNQDKYIWKIPEKYHYNSWIAERTNHWLDEYKKSDEPFFLWASFFDPHPDYFVPEPWASMYDPDSLTLPKQVEGEHNDSPPHIQETQKPTPDFSSYKESGKTIHGFHCQLKDEAVLRKDLAVYYGMVSMMDHYIGKILDHLEQTGLSDSTMVIFTSDHGHYFGHHGLTAKGAFHYDDGIKVPFITSCPGSIPENIVSDSLVSLVDMAPTFLSALNCPIPGTMSGHDMMDLFANPYSTLRDIVICENQHEPTTVNLRTYIDNRYKLTIYFNRDYGELYDLADDPDEVVNLWGHPESAEVKSRLLLQAIWGEMGKAILPMPRIAGA
ncbi:MAG: sulfatase-like hydrolase/transferase [Bacteroidetes bacterium]|nr:sulfatase-like hydrolase/transferase [Bacteroidota bacterium]